MHCSSVLKPNSAFYSLQGLLSGPVAIETRWQDIARISHNGSPDAIHSAPVEELHSPEETKGTLVLAISLCKSTYICSNLSTMEGKRGYGPSVVLSKATKLFVGVKGNRRDLLQKLSPIEVSRL